MQFPGKSPLHTFCSSAFFAPYFNTRGETLAIQKKTLCFYCANKSTRKLLNQVSETESPPLFLPVYVHLVLTQDQRNPETPYEGKTKQRQLRNKKQQQPTVQTFPTLFFAIFLLGDRGESAGKVGGKWSREEPKLRQHANQNKWELNRTTILV